MERRGSEIDFLSKNVPSEDVDVCLNFELGDFVGHRQKRIVHIIDAACKTGDLADSNLVCVIADETIRAFDNFCRTGCSAF